MIKASVKNEWKEITIGQLGRIVTGSTPSTKRSEFFGDKYPFITPSDIDGNSRYPVTERFLSEEGYENQKRRLLPPKSVCFTSIGATIGKLCMTSTESFSNQQINNIIVDKKNFENYFVYYLLKNEAERIKSFAGGAATPIINKTSFSNLKVRVPPLEVQREIAPILSAYDDLIENNTRRIKILEEMAQSFYREWFINFRFPGHEKVKMVDSPLGKIPKGWVPVKLSEVASINEASIKKKGEPERIRYVDIASVSTGTVDSVEDIVFADAPGRARRIVKNGDIIWATVRPYRKSYSLILNPPSNLIVSTGFAVVTPRMVPFSFLYQALTTDNFVDYLTNCAKGSAYPAVSSEDFRNAPILLPAERLLNEFHKAGESLFEIKQNLLKKNNNLQRTRDLLLPKLLADTKKASLS